MTNVRIYRADTASCNGCDIEIVGILAPRFKLGEMNISVVDEPEEANAMVVTGGVTGKSLEEVKAAYEKLQDPKVVIAVGACALSKGVFREGYPLKGGIDLHLPVDVFVSGCPPKPQALVHALADLLEIDLDYSDAFWTPPEGARGKPVRDEEKCTACGACVNLCPSAALELLDEKIDDKPHKVVRLNYWRCVYCGTCQDVCPEDAVELSTDYRVHFAGKDLAFTDVEVEMAACPISGEFASTHRQQRVVLARLMEVPGFRQHPIQLKKWCALSPDAARDVSGIRTRKWQMFGMMKD